MMEIMTLQLCFYITPGFGPANCKPCYCCIEFTRLAEDTFGNEKAAHSRIKQATTLRDLRLPPRSSCELRSSGLSCTEKW